MGCDVYLCVERRTPDHSWERAEPLVRNEDYGTWPDEPEFYRDAVSSGRNYRLFTILANVRNSFNGEILPIDDPRGIPGDVTEETRREVDDYDGHDHSWLLLRELLDYDWNRKICLPKQVLVSETLKHPIGAKVVKAIGAGVATVGGGIAKVVLPSKFSIGFALPHFIGRWLDTEQEYRTEWKEVVLADEVADFVNQTLPTLQRYGAPEDIRIVFWFDS